MTTSFIISIIAVTFTAICVVCTIHDFLNKVEWDTTDEIIMIISYAITGILWVIAYYI